MSENEKTVEKKPRSKAMGCLSLIVIVVAVIVVVSALSGGGDKEAGKALETWASATDISQEAIATALGTKPPAEPVADDYKFPKSISKIEVSDNAGGGKKVNVVFTSADVLDETDFVKRAGGTAIEIGSILFQNPEISMVIIVDQIEMTDKYGKKKLEDGAKLILDKATADKVDWKGLADNHTMDPGNIYRLTNTYEINPGILKNVKLDEVKLN